jgi:hypothetical protein
MNIVEKEAKKFIDNFYNDGKVNTLEKLKTQLTSKVYDFNRKRDQLDFLKVLRQDTISQKEDHLKECQRQGCHFPEERDLGLFVIDQEIDSINEYYVFEPKSTDKFTSEQESKLHNKLNEIIDQLTKQGYGQEIIFEEIESLKNHFNLGKKNWFQLLKGKVVDLTFEGIIEKTVVAGIYENLSDGYKDIVKLLQ